MGSYVCVPMIAITIETIHTINLVISSWLLNDCDMRLSLQPEFHRIHHS